MSTPGDEAVLWLLDRCSGYHNDPETFHRRAGEPDPDLLAAAAHRIKELMELPVELDRLRAVIARAEERSGVVVVALEAAIGVLRR
jgi:hypothetical protein